MRSILCAGLLMLAVFGAVLSSCQSGDLDVGQNVIQPNGMSVSLIDTMTVNAYTIMSPDSFATSSDGTLLIGNWTNAQTGRVTARGFTNVDYATNSIATQTNIQFDSLVIELTYNLRYGDTTSLFNVQVHQLERPLNSLLTYYNTDSVSYQATPLLLQSFRPSTQTGVRQFRLRLPTNVGQAFFQRLASNSINSTETINNYWKGFAFKTTNTNNLFLGVNITSEQTGLRLYYHTNDVAQTQTNVRFSLSGVHFTQLTNNVSGTPLQTLVNSSDAVSSKKTGNTTVVAPGLGIYTRLDIPGLNNYSRPERFAGLTRAELLIEPVRQSQRDNAPPPSPLVLYQVNTNNNLFPVLVLQPDGTLAPQIQAVSSSATYIASNELTALELKDYYNFDITAHVNDVIRGTTPNRPLLVTVPSATNLSDRIRRVTLGDQQNATDRIRLRLYITTDQ